MVAYLIGGEQQRGFIEQVKSHITKECAAAVFIGPNPQELGWISTLDGIDAHLAVLFAGAASEPECKLLKSIVEMLRVHQTPMIVVYEDRNYRPTYLESDAGLNVCASFMPKASFGMTTQNGFAPQNERSCTGEDRASHIAAGISAFKPPRSLAPPLPSS